LLLAPYHIAIGTEQYKLNAVPTLITVVRQLRIFNVAVLSDEIESKSNVIFRGHVRPPIDK
jgi:hypothetical protein